jgi:hypothetical protein
MKKTLLALLAFMIFYCASAQILRIPTSPEVIESKIPGFSEIKQIDTKKYPFPSSKLARRDTAGAFETSRMLPVKLTTADGNQTTTALGTVWTLKIQIDEASSLGVIFDLFELAEEALLFTYNEDRNLMDSAISRQNFNYAKVVSINPIPGPSITLHIVEPGNQGPLQSKLSIQRLIAGQARKFGNRETAPLDATFGIASLECTPSVQCSPTKMPYARAVGRLTINGTTSSANCSCTMLNNESSNGRPIALTAYHCLDLDKNGALSPAELANLNFSTVEFQYWMTNCGGSVANSTIQFTGLSLLQSSGISDYAVLELLNPPGIGDRVNYAGWNRQAGPPTVNESFILHHPYGEDMRITTTSNVRHYPLNSTRFWEVFNLNGVVAPGSSGSGLFNQHGQVVGQLSKGGSSCSSPNLSDLYGKIEWAWNINNLGSILSPTQNATAANLLNLTDIPINGPGTLSCTIPATFTTIPGLSGVNYSWSVTSGLHINNGQGTASVSISGVPGYGSGFLTLTLSSPNKGVVRTMSVTRRIFINSGGTGNISGTYNSPTSPTAPLVSSTTTYNNTCLAACTNMNMPAGATPIWTANSLSPGVTWTQSGKDICVYFTAINQTADFTLSTGSTCTSTSRFRFKCVNNSACGIIPPFAPLVSPNPASSQINVSLQEGMSGSSFNGIKEIRITDKLGSIKSTHQFKQPVQTTTINVAQLPPDVYTLLIFDGNKWVAKKFIKK